MHSSPDITIVGSTLNQPVATQYRAKHLRVQEPGKLELMFTPDGGGEKQTFEAVNMITFP